jgi:hypothetical protein
MCCPNLTTTKIHWNFKQNAPYKKINPKKEKKKEKNELPLLL